MGGGNTEHFTFQEVLNLFLFVVLLWVFGKAFEFMKAPALIGEILLGAIFGPLLINLDVEDYALMIIGEVGLILLVIEAGLEVNLAMMRQIGGRGILIGFCGSFLPLVIAFGIATGLGFAPTAALAAGASFSPTSMGVALVVLKSSGVLTTPMGQMVVTAAVVDDIIALVILSMLKAIANPSPIAFIAPIIAAVGFSSVIGCAAVFLFPPLIERFILKPYRHNQDLVANILLASIFLVSLTLMVCLNYGRGSYLLGAFLGGVCFCTVEEAMHAWQSQVKRILKWLLRFFFACTVGFQVPIASFWTPKVLSIGAAFFCAIVGKLWLGVFASPLTLDKFLLVGLSMSTWGEFAFIIVVEAKSQRLIDSEQYAGIVFAILLSIIISPYLLRYHLARTQDSGNAHVVGKVYYKLLLRVRNAWGFQPALLAHLTGLLLEVLDFRCNISDNMCVYEAYIKDTVLVDEEPHNEHANGLPERLEVLRERIYQFCLSHDPECKRHPVNIIEHAEVALLHGAQLTRYLPLGTAEDWIEFGVNEATAHSRMADAGFRSSLSSSEALELERHALLPIANAKTV